MTPPVGTFLSPLRKGALQMPPPLLRYCVSAGWTLVHFIVVDHDHLTMQPVLPDDPLADEDAVRTLLRKPVDTFDASCHGLAGKAVQADRRSGITS